MKVFIHLINCKKPAIAFIVVWYLITKTGIVSGQVALYGFTSGITTFTPIAGGSVLAAGTGNTIDDQTYLNKSIGFNFVYNGGIYTTFSVDANGYIVLGSSVVGVNSNVLSAETNAISALNYNIQANGTIAGEIRFQSTATKCTIQWLHMKTSGGNDGQDFNFQIILYKTSNAIQIVYGTMNTNSGMTARSPQVGLCGNPNSDFQDLTGSSWSNPGLGSANTSTMTLSNLVKPLSGQTYTFTPPPTLTNFSPASGCSGMAQNIIIAGTNFTGATAVKFGSVDAAFTVNSSTQITATMPSTLPAGSYIIYITTPGGTSTSGSSFAINQSPAITSISSSFEVCKNTPFDLNVIASNVTSYQWQLGQVDISGGSTSTYSVPSAATSNTGTYNVVISNANCSVTSDDIDVKLNSLPGTVIISPSNAITDCYGYINSVTAKAQSSQTTILIQKFNQTAAAPPSGWTASYSGSTGGTPANAAWTFKPDGYTYIIYHSAFPGPYYNDYTFYSNDNTQFIMSNSDEQSGTKTNTVLTSKAVDTRPYQSLTLTYYDFFERNSGSADTGYVQVSTDGVNFTTVQKILNSTNNGRKSTGYYNNGTELHFTYQVDFNQESIDLSSYIGVSNLYIRFNYTAGNTGFFWCIDNVLLQGNDQSQNITWSPVTNLYTDANATISYSGTNLTSVYAKVLNNQSYTITASDANGCTSIGNISVSLSGSPTWTGLNSSAWNDLSNWCNGIVPDGNTNIIIPPSTPHSPVLNGDYLVNDINIVAGAILDLNGHNLTVNGAFNASGTGTITGSHTSGLIINTNGNAGTAYFSSGSLPNSYTNNYLKTFTINPAAAIALGDSLNITAGASVNAFGTVTANGTLTTNGYLTLKSNANGDAIVGQSTGTISGQVTVERYIPYRRAWRFLGVPVNSTQTINEAWQEGAVNPDLYTQLNPNPGFGTDITYAGINGYDPNVTANPSIKTWVNGNWYTPNSTYIPINTYNAYCIFVRGSRAVNLSQGVYAIPQDNTVLRAAGGLNQTNGAPVNRTYSGTVAGDYVFIGNPYASPIDLQSIIDGTRSGASGFDVSKFWIWDPHISGINNVGGYVAYDNGFQVPYTAGTVIQSGQAFMLQLSTASTSATVKFQESDKSVFQTNVFSKPMLKELLPAIYTNLMRPSADGLLLTDGVGAGFGNYSSAVDTKDAAKQWNTDENIALVRNEARLAIELRPLPVLTDTLFYKLFLVKQQPYVLQIFSRDLPPNTLYGWLVDKYLNTKTAVNLYDTTLYNFTSNTDTNSYRNRFMLVYKRMFIAMPVPVTKVANQANPGTTGNAGSMATQGKVSVHPNLIKTGEKVMLQFSNMAKGKYQVTVTNTAGKALAERTVEHNGRSSTYALQTDARWASGNYFIKITAENGYSLITKLMIGK